MRRSWPVASVVWMVTAALPVAGLPAQTAQARAGQGVLPGLYFDLLDRGAAGILDRLARDPGATLATIESQPGSRHFPSAILVMAVLYKVEHPSNTRRGTRNLFDAAVAIGDLLVRESDSGAYGERLDHHRDSYMWLEAYRLLEAELGDQRRANWKAALLKNIAPLAADVAKRQDYPQYNSPYLITSPNHFGLWSSTVFLAGHIFGNEEWKQLGAKVLHRFAAEEQSPDGFWGEHTRAGPTTGYDYLTSSGVAMYWEYSHDPAALEALRRSARFHMNYTYPDGTPVEVINDRNRHWDVSPWGHFGFSNFPDGRRYAEFLTQRLSNGPLGLETLGRLAQDALYYHEGPPEPIPPDREQYSHQMTTPAGIRKTGPWVTALSGIIVPPTLSQFYLDRQANLSVFHNEKGLIITGANSKRQPELATFSEQIEGQTYHLPMSSRLDISPGEDRLALAYNKFVAVLRIPRPAGDSMEFSFDIRPKGRMAPTTLTLQLVMRRGDAIKTGAGEIAAVGASPIDWDATRVGGSIEHNGWKISSKAPLKLVWPVYPFNPYANGPETNLQYAVGALSTAVPPGEQTISFRLEVE